MTTLSKRTFVRRHERVIPVSHVNKTVCTGYIITPQRSRGFCFNHAVFAVFCLSRCLSVCLFVILFHVHQMISASPSRLHTFNSRYRYRSGTQFEKNCFIPDFSAFCLNKGNRVIWTCNLFVFVSCLVCFLNYCMLLCWFYLVKIYIIRFYELLFTGRRKKQGSALVPRERVRHGVPCQQVHPQGTHPWPWQCSALV